MFKYYEDTVQSITFHIVGIKSENRILLKKKKGKYIIPDENLY